jgi:L-asparaginase II
VEINGIGTAIDGCGVPTFHLPIHNLALGYARLCSFRRTDVVSSAALQKIFEAMGHHPEMVAGDGRFETELARMFGGKAIAKPGGEAMMAVGFNDPPWGVTIKIEDGSQRSVPLITVEILKMLQLVDPAVADSLAECRRKIFNSEGKIVGIIEVVNDIYE